MLSLRSSTSLQPFPHLRMLIASVQGVVMWIVVIYRYCTLHHPLLIVASNYYCVLDLLNSLN